MMPDGWSYESVTKFEVPAGQYYIGDLCYALDQDVYYKVFGGQGFQPGLYTYGHDLFGLNFTAIGDGTYLDSEDREYDVDSGTLGLCSIGLAARGTEGGQVINFWAPTDCHFFHGIFEFSNGLSTLFAIDTTPTDDDSSNDESE